MSHPTTENTWGPGTYCDQTFIPVPQDAKRLLTHLADITPGFTKDQKALEDVQFVGQDLPLLPGPLKAQVLVCFCFHHKELKADAQVVCSTSCYDRHSRQRTAGNEGNQGR